MENGETMEKQEVTDSGLRGNWRMANTEKGFPDHLMYKNRLQEYTQLLGLDLPVYQTINEGFAHAARFRANVTVNGTAYISRQTFPHKKVAEQDAAKMALECVQETMKDDGCSAVHQDPKSCKSILHEFAAKTNQEPPKYTTTQNDKLHPIFVSSVTFCGKTYTGEAAKNRKDAEQLAAQNAIKSLLGSGSVILHQIVRSKKKAHVIKQINSQINEKPESLVEQVNFLDPTSFKSILHEFAFKMNRELSNYTTIQKDELHPVFVSSITFDGKTYTSELAKRKKDAEQLAARNAIQSLLESGSEILQQIVSSKNKASGIKQINLQINEKPESSVQPINNLLPPPNMLSQNPRINQSSCQKKRKLEDDENWTQRKKQDCHR